MDDCVVPDDDGADGGVGGDNDANIADVANEWSPSAPKKFQWLYTMTNPIVALLDGGY